ncbi:hypothetical protein JTE90_012221 [Oedothorax gibbosus]|uniref:Lipase domain-containing protein n=1 Tax=Oedothorax gibbosus TaxID=931172 RepID=A0AAV6TK71_9ARAC|nr:hypothetical protein JTE90_012221 [Oedothorax gibbosus]
MLFCLQLKTGLTLDKVHIIGHSLGSHAAGFAGKWLKYKLKQRVRRITGLDVAGPDFEDYEVGRRLDRSDAEFVDTIHSNAALSVTDGFGIMKPVGHFDFYPNGGELQPGCETSMGAIGNIASETLEIINPMYSLMALLRGDKKDIGDAVEDLSCNHGRAIQFFIESITSASCQFIAEECDSWVDYLAGKCNTGAKVPMGYDSEKYKGYMDEYASKNFYLSTNSNTPFCKKL